MTVPRNPRNSSAIALLIAVCLVSFPAQGKYGGGTGEPDDPYRIATAEDLMLLGDSPEDYDKHFILTADIDLGPNLPGRKVFDRAVIAPETNAVEWDFQGTPFSGSFDGNDHKISNLTVTGQDYLGLFGAVHSQAQIAGLGIIDVNVISTGEGAQHIGGLVGANYGNLMNCYSTGNITDDFDVGGLIGTGDVGGLIGTNDGSVSNCYSSVNITGASSTVGGLVGVNFGSVSNCYSTGNIIGDLEVGGLVGDNWDGSVSNSYSTATVTGSDFVGGLAGSNEGSISNCYSAGTVTGAWLVGGLVGNNDGNVSNCYSTGNITGGFEVGGLVGLDWLGNITSSFWDTQTSGLSWSSGGTGKTTAEMQAAGTFLNAGWDFVDKAQNGTDDSWVICEGTNYPRFAWQIPPGDFVCPDGVTVVDFSLFATHWLDDNCDPSNDYCEGTDLGLSGAVDINDLEALTDNWLTGIAP